MKRKLKKIIDEYIFTDHDGDKQHAFDYLLLTVIDSSYPELGAFLKAHDWDLSTENIEGYEKGFDTFFDDFLDGISNIFKREEQKLKEVLSKNVLEKILILIECERIKRGINDKKTKRKIRISNR